MRTSLFLSIKKNHPPFHSFLDYMHYFKTLEELKQANLGRVCITIGNFDGIHIGHQVILSKLKSLASNFAPCQTLLIIFEPQPLEFFNQPKGRIYTVDQKLEVCDSHQLVDNVLTIDFTQEFADVSAQDFIKALCTSLDVKAFLIGDDFRFGKQRAGNFQTFVDLAPTYGYQIEKVDTISLGTERISSTSIRNFLDQGNFAQANSLLLEPFHFTGPVVSGNKLARTLNCPTANLVIQRKKSPIHGTYMCNVLIEGDPIKYSGICNIGYKPTIQDDKSKWVCEVHILNFNRDIYGKQVKVYPIKKHRDEIKFESIDALKSQIYSDIDQAYEFFQLEKQVDLPPCQYQDKH